MVITGKIIHELNSFAKGFFGGREEICSEDIVQDALLEAFESGKNSIEEIKKAIRRKSIDTRHQRTKDSRDAFSNTQVSRYCKCCKEDLPIAMFFILQYKDEKKKKIISRFCKSCENKESAKRYRRKHPILRPNKKYFTQEEQAEAKRKLAKESYERRKLQPGFMEKQAERARLRHQTKKAA